MKKTIFTSSDLSIRAVLALTLAAVSIAGCGKIDDMQSKTSDMSKTTKDMSGTTRKLNATTEKMYDTTINLSGQTDELLDITRQGGALKIREDAIDRLWAAKTPAMKLAQTCFYFTAFEYQFWTGTGQDQTQEKRLTLMHEATVEFMKVAKDFLVDSGDINPIAVRMATDGVDSDNNKQLSFNALAAGMSKVDRKQEEMLKKHPEMKPVTMESMILESLASLKAIRDGKMKLSAVPAYQRELIQQETLIKRLMRARLNFIPMIVISEMAIVSDLSEGSEGTAPTLLKMYGATKAPWHLDMKRTNPIQLAVWTSYFQAFGQLAALLSANDVTVSLNPFVAALIGNLQLTNAEGAIAPTEASAVTKKFQDTVLSVQELAKSLLTPPPPPPPPAPETAPAKP